MYCDKKCHGQTNHCSLFAKIKAVLVRDDVGLNVFTFTLLYVHGGEMAY